MEHIYGRVLSRPLVGLRMRELCTLSILAGQGVPLQMVISSSNSFARVDRCDHDRDSKCARFYVPTESFRPSFFYDPAVICYLLDRKVCSLLLG